MARLCTICNHVERKNIDKSLVEPGAKLSSIALRYGVSKYALKRHVEHGHILEKIQRVRNAEEAVEVEGFLQKIARKHRRFDQMQEQAQTDKDAHLELKVLREQAKYFDMEGKACGVFREKIEHTGPGGGPMESVVIYIPDNKRDPAP